MEVLINNTRRKVIITRKRKNKHTYLRVKEDLNIYVTTNNYVSEKQILKLIIENTEYFEKLFKKELLKKENDKYFFLLGKKYDIVYTNIKNPILGASKIFINREIDLQKWYLKQAKVIFLEELDHIYSIYPEKIPYPSLTIRKMKTRWGVCNIKTKRITLNLELIKKDKKYLDYVIVHELSHLIHPNHSKSFWNLVERVVPDYKTLRKELNNYES